MKKTTLVLAFFAFFGIFKANAISFSKTVEPTNSSYVVNDEAIESLFTNSTDISTSLVNESSDESLNLFGTEASSSNAMFKKSSGGKSAIAAIVIDFFLGGLGIHRAYLGTKTFTWIGYILTCGGIFGIVPFVDLIVLIVNAGDISKYEGNSKFFMW